MRLLSEVLDGLVLNWPLAKLCRILSMSMLGVVELFEFVLLSNDVEWLGSGGDCINGKCAGLSVSGYRLIDW